MAPQWFNEMLGWKAATKKARPRCQRLFGADLGPNLADLSGTSSAAIAGEMYRLAGIGQERRTNLDLGTDDPSPSAGVVLERSLEVDLRDELLDRESDRGWEVTRSGSVQRFAQYSHLADLQKIFEDQPVLRNTVSSDYEVSTDVMVSLPNPEGADRPRILHAAVSSKLTIRSDRVQNIRYEFGTLVRNRKGRLPHLVVVTAEPLPSRLVSIARGTGEIDAVYHLMFEEMSEVAQMDEIAGIPRKTWANQRGAWTEMVEQGRIKSYAELVSTLALG